MTRKIGKVAKQINIQDSPLNFKTEYKHLAEIEILQLASIVESCNDAIYSKSFDGTIFTWNKAAENIFGFTAQEAIGKNISIIFSSEILAEEAEIDETIKRGEQIDHYETARIRKD